MTGITQQAGALASDLTIHTTHGTFSAPFVAKRYVPAFLALFPDGEISAPLGKEWYNDPTRLSYVATYTNEKVMQQEVEAASKCGWMPQGTTATGSHINVGRTMTKFVLTGGLGLMTGASRSKDKITITFVRTPEWLAHR